MGIVIYSSEKPNQISRTRLTAKQSKKYFSSSNTSLGKAINELKLIEIYLHGENKKNIRNIIDYLHELESNKKLKEVV